MTSKQEKRIEFTKSIVKFVNSNQTTLDFMELFFNVNKVLKQGNGLLWEEIEKILKEVIGE